MYQHFILVASSYTTGKRVGLHLVKKGQLDKSEIEKTMKRIDEIKRNDIGVHSIITDKYEWESVVAFDSFFEDVTVCKDLDEFEKVLICDTKITAMDIAKFFLAFSPMSHLKLQKLVYLSYRDYLIEYGRPLFKEKIIAYKYGPVVEEIYQSFKQYGADDIAMDDDGLYKLNDIQLPQAVGRMLLVQEEDVVLFLLKMIGKYENFTAEELVNLTHSKHGAWDTVYREKQNCEITDDVILSQWKYEKAS